MSGSFREVGPRVRVIAIVLAMAFLPDTLAAESLPEISPPPASSRFT